MPRGCAAARPGHEPAVAPHHRGLRRALCGLFGAAAILAPQPRLIWNASASVPVGLYAIDVGAEPARGDLVAIAPPAPLSAWLSKRGYLPRGAPLLKRVAATSGALVCRSGVFVTIDGAPAARARSADRMGRTLPLWLGCRQLGRGELFVLGLIVALVAYRLLIGIRRNRRQRHPVASATPYRHAASRRRNGARHSTNLPDEEQTS